MLSLVIGNNEPVCNRVRKQLIDNGLECPPANVVALDAATDRASRLAPALAVIVMPADVESALTIVRQIENAVGCQILAIGPANDPKLILRAMQEGADEYLDVNEVDDELGEAIIRFKSRHDGEQHESDAPGRVISVMAPSGGCGSSTVAANIAMTLARHHGTCSLLDLRLAAGDLAPLLDLQPTHTIADLSENLDRVDPGMFEKCFAKHKHGLELLAAPKDLSQIADIESGVVRQVLSMARRKFDYVVTDLDHTFGPEQIEALWQSEIILVVVRLDYTSIRNARRTFDYFEQIGIGLDRVQVVVNRHGEKKQLGLRQAEEALGVKVSYSIPDDPSRVNTAINAGIPVVLQAPSAKISKRLASLAYSVNGAHASAKDAKGRK